MTSLSSSSPPTLPSSSPPTLPSSSSPTLLSSSSPTLPSSLSSTLPSSSSPTLPSSSSPTLPLSSSPTLPPSSSPTLPPSSSPILSSSSLLPLPLSSSSLSPIIGKKRKAMDIITQVPEKKQCIISDTSYFCPSIEVPLQANGTVNIFEVVKSVVCTFDPKTIALGSFRSYKNSNNLLIDSKQNIRVPRESVYEAEMYRILTNWLAKVHEFEITSQWHLEKVCEDGDYHHFYCDLTIKKTDVPNPIAVIEILATGTVSKIKKHFNQVLNYANQLGSQEAWIVHFSREDSVVSDPCWPNNKLQKRGLNVVHFWHDKDFKNIRISAKFQDATGKFNEIINEQIIP